MLYIKLNISQQEDMQSVSKDIVISRYCLEYTHNLITKYDIKYIKILISKQNVIRMKCYYG